MELMHLGGGMCAQGGEMDKEVLDDFISSLHVPAISVTQLLPCFENVLYISCLLALQKLTWGGDVRGCLR